MPQPDLSGYEEVVDRIPKFLAKYPEGSLSGEGDFVRDGQGDIIGFIYRAEANRTPDDPKPGIGTAYEQIPGKTPYTRDSEVMNAETSAWGRALAALGFVSKKSVASRDEVQTAKAKQAMRPPEHSSPAAHGEGAGQNAVEPR